MEDIVFLLAIPVLFAATAWLVLRTSKALANLSDSHTDEKNPVVS